MARQETNAAAPLRKVLLGGLLCALALTGTATGDAAERGEQPSVASVETSADPNADGELEGPPAVASAPEAEAVLSDMADAVDGDNPRGVQEFLAAVNLPVTPRPPQIVNQCVPPEIRVIREYQSSMMTKAFAKAVDHILYGVKITANMIELATGGTVNRYSEIRPKGKKLDLEVGCCLNNDSDPTLYRVTQNDDRVIVEAGLILDQPIGLHFLLSRLPQTMLIERVSKVGKRADTFLEKIGLEVKFRAFGEGNASGGVKWFDKLTATPPCISCDITGDFSGTVMAGGGPRIMIKPGVAIGVHKDVKLLAVAIDGQVWAKLSPIGAEFTCDGPKWLRPRFQFCTQFRVRLFDWVDLETQVCRDSFGELLGTII